MADELKPEETPQAAGVTDAQEKSGGSTDVPKNQAEIDRIIEQRLARERAKYVDYDKIKSKAEELEQKLREKEEAEMSELEKARKRAEELEAEKASLLTYKEKLEKINQRLEEKVNEALTEIDESDRELVLQLPLESRMDLINRLKAKAANASGIYPGKGAAPEGTMTVDQIMEIRDKYGAGSRQYLEAIRKRRQAITA